MGRDARFACEFVPQNYGLFARVTASTRAIMQIAAG
jgi:hypothetical protein